jgi:hypothetical protein
MSLPSWLSKKLIAVILTGVVLPIVGGLDLPSDLKNAIVEAIKWVVATYLVAQGSVDAMGVYKGTKKP